MRLVAAIVIGAIVARYLGPESLGKLNFAHSFVMIFLVFSTLGLDSVVVKYLVSDDEDRDEILGTVLSVKLFAGTVSFVLIVLLTYLFGYDLDTKIGISIVATTQIFQCFNVLDLYFQSQVKSKFVVVSNIVSVLVSSILKIIFVLYGLDVIWFISVFAIESLVLSTSLCIAYKKQGQSILKWKSSIKLAKKLLSKSWPLMLSGLTISIYMKVDQLMIKELLNFEELGYYSAALKLSETWYFLPMVVSASFFPSLVNSFDNKNQYLSRFQLLYDGLLIISFALSICTVVVAPYLIDFLYGEAYSKSSDVLTLQIWASIFVFNGVASSKWFVINHEEKTLMYITTMACGINIVLNYIVIPKYGVNGAAFTTIISQAFSSFFGMFFFYGKCKENIYLMARSFNIYSSSKRLLNEIKNFSH